MSKLKLGKMNYKELSEWRGVKEATFKRFFVKRYSKELEEYCEFKRYKENGKYAGIEVISIEEEEFLKKNEKRDKLLLEVGKQLIKESDDHFINGKYVALDFIHKYPEYKDQCSLKRYAVLFNKAIKEEYPDIKDAEKGRSRSYRQLGVKPMLDRCYPEGDEKNEAEYFAGKPRLMTEKEISIFKEICNDGSYEYWSDVILTYLSESNKYEEIAVEIQKASFREKLRKFRSRTGMIIVAGRVYEEGGKVYFVEEKEFNFNEDAE